MSVRNSLLAILDDAPAHGYGLKSAFEHRTAGAWPLNVGQVYTTLARLERDGLVAPQGSGPGVGGRDRQRWRITRAGRAALAAWYGGTVDDRALRDELSMKVLLALAGESGDVGEIIQKQRASAMERLQEYTRDKRSVAGDNLPWLLLLDALILKTQAELKWLDLCEQRIERRRSGR